jgi:hypothetical protein
MHLAYEAGANRIWIVNVGDIKPIEFPTQFFLDYAWNPERWPAERLPEYTRRWAGADVRRRTRGRDRGHRHDVLEVQRPPKAGAARAETYSLTNYREAETVVADYNALAARAERISAALPADYRDAFYQLVLHPVQASVNLNDLYVTVAQNRLYAQQGRAATNDLADRARRLFERDAEISRYYNTELAGGKWSHMMDQTHIGYTYWQEPPRNVMPRVDMIQVPVPAEMGVAFEGQVPLGVPGQGPPPGSSARTREPALPEFDVYQRQSYYIDVYNRGQTPFTYSAKAAESWVVISPTSGTVEKQQRVMVSIDWDRVPDGKHRVPITLDGPGTAGIGTGPRVIQVIVNNPGGSEARRRHGLHRGQRLRVDGGRALQLEPSRRRRFAGSASRLRPDAVGHDSASEHDCIADARRKWDSPRVPRVPVRHWRRDRKGVRLADAELLRCEGRRAVCRVDGRGGTAAGEHHGGQLQRGLGEVGRRQHPHSRDEAPRRSARRSHTQVLARGSWCGSAEADHRRGR